jgi:hypothetical protein
MRRFGFCALLFAVFAVPLAAQHQAHGADGNHPLPAGWQARADRADQNVREVMFMAMGSGFHVRTGPAVILWNADHSADGSYTVTTTFTQTKAPERLEAYGIFFGGADLSGEGQAYTYFLVRHDGRFTVKNRQGMERPPTLIDWTEHAAVVKADDNGRLQNTLSVEVGADKVRFLANGTEVASLDRSIVTATNGIAGLRVNHGLDLRVENFAVSKGM